MNKEIIQKNQKKKKKLKNWFTLKLYLKTALHFNITGVVIQRSYEDIKITMSYAISYLQCFLI